MEEFLQSCIQCTGAVIENEYRAYNDYCYFSSEGELIEPENKSHPDFQFAEDEIIQLEIGGELLQEATCLEYIAKFTLETQHFGNIAA